MELFSLFGRIFIDDKEAGSSLDSIDKKAGGLGSKFGLLAKGAGIAAGMLGAAFLAISVGAVKDVAEAEKHVAQLEAVLKSTGGAAGVTKDQALELAEAFEKTTTFSAESTLAAQNLLLTFTNIGKDVFPEATKTALDMATALGTDAASQSIQLGKALNDPTNGISALTRVGVTFTEEQKNVIEALQATGDMAGAQTIILQELQREFGGSAEAAGNTFAGKLEIAKNALGNMAEKIGVALMPYLQQMLDWILLHMPEIEMVFEYVFNVIGIVISTTIEWIKVIIDWVKSWARENNDQLTAIKDLFIELFQSISDFISAFIEWAKLVWMQYGDEISVILKAGWDLIVIIFTTAITIIKDIFNVFAALFKGDWQGLWDAIKILFYDVFERIKNIFSGVYDWFVARLALFTTMISDNWKTSWTAIKDFFAGIWDGIVQVAKDRINLVIGLINKMINALNSIKFTIPDFVPDIGGETISFKIPKVPYLAKGGNVIGRGSFISGEAGAELVTLGSNGATVIPLTNQQKESVYSGPDQNRSITQNITINSPSPLSPSEVARKSLQASRKLAMEWGI